MDSLAVLEDFFYEMWVHQFYKVAITQFIFWLYYLYKRVPVIVDVAYTTSHFVIGLALFIEYTAEPFYIKPFLIILLLGIWWIRLGGYIFFTRVWNAYLDPRYEKLSENTQNKAIFFLVNYEFQGIIVVLTASPLYFDFRKPDYINIFTLSSGIAFIVVGIIFEAISDYQLYVWKKTNKVKGAIFQEGLWKKSRHPNLFFELMTWVGFALIGCNDELIDLVGFLGPIILYCVMRFLTVPITEKYMLETRGEQFNEFVSRTNMFFPA